MGWRRLLLGVVVVGCLFGIVAPPAEAGVKYWQVAGSQWYLVGTVKEKLTGWGSETWPAEAYAMFGPRMGPPVNLDWDEAILTIYGMPVRSNYGLDSGRLILYLEPGRWRDIVGDSLDYLVGCEMGCDLQDFCLKKKKLVAKVKPWQSMKVKVKIKAIAQVLCDSEPEELKYSATARFESPSWWWPYP